MKKFLKQYFSFIKPYKLTFIWFMLALTALGIVNTINPYVYKLFVDALPAREYKTIMVLLAVFVGVRLLDLSLDLIVYYLGDKVLIRAARDARSKIFAKIQELDFAFHLSKSSGSLISIFKRGDLAYFNLFHELNVLYRIVVSLLMMLITFSTLDWRIASLMAGTFILSSIATKYLLSYNFRTRKRFNQAEDRISEVIIDNLINYETVKYFGKEQKEQLRLKRTFKAWTNKLWKFANSFRLIDIVIGLISTSGLWVVMLVASKLYLAKNLTLAEFILIMSFITSFYGRFFEAVYRIRAVVKNYSDLTDYFDILDKETMVKDPVKPIKLKRIKGEIVFNNISFSYHDGKKDALKNFNLRIRAGQSIALVGKSGVGKTTIVKLLLRFFDVDKGEITLDGVDIRKLTKADLRSHIGIVPQEPIMFNNTLLYNITYGTKRPTQQAIEKAVKMAHLDEFVNQLPKGYKTIVGERGVKLSGGQRQRLAIARMILSDPDIVIFDEATSQLDSESEKYIQDAFWKASKNKTTIIIAHRLSTVVKADKIIVMENGKIAEMGSHRELVHKKDGLYKKYWDLQASEL